MIGSWGQFYKQVFAPTGAIQALFLQYRRNVTAQPLFKETLMINVKSSCQAWVTLSTSAFSIQLAYICSFMHVKQKSICSKFQLALVTYVLKFSVKMIYFLFVKNSKWHLQTQGHSEDEGKKSERMRRFFSLKLAQNRFDKTIFRSCRLTLFLYTCKFRMRSFNRKISIFTPTVIDS
jgi:hypothetical protein